MSGEIDGRVVSRNAFHNAHLMLNGLTTSDLWDFKSQVSERRIALLTGDMLVAVGVTLLTLFVWGAIDGSSTGLDYVLAYSYWCPLVAGAWWICGRFNDLYQLPSAHDRRRTLRAIVPTGAIGLVALLALFLLAPVAPSFRVVATAWLVTTVGVLAWRFSYIALSDVLLPFNHRVLIVGQGTRARAMVDALEAFPSGLDHAVGYVEDPADDGQQWQSDLPHLGSIEHLPQITKQHNIHQVIVATEGHVSASLFNALIRCQASGVAVVWMPDAYERLLHRIPVEHINPAWGLNAVQGSSIFHRLQLISKRLGDLMLFILALPVLALLFPLLAVVIKLDSRGPVFYKQTRSGRCGQPFTIYKFRTMRSDAEKNGPQWAEKNDNRITRTGRFLRKTRLDELPQIINVFRGEMSFVGPRPERPEFIKELAKEIPFYMARMLVKPGLTGWAQVHYDYGNTVEDALVKLQYDFYYVRYWSFWMDIYILFRTIAVVVQFKGL